MEDIDKSRIAFVPATAILDPKTRLYRKLASS